MTQLFHLRRFTWLGCALLTVLWQSAAAAEPLDLLETWRLAVSNDPQYRAEQAEAAAGSEKIQQARSLWLPTVAASATAGRGGNKNSTQGAQFITPSMNSENVEFNTSIRGGDLYSYELGVKQPLLDRARLAQSRQLRLSAQVADVQWQNAQQRLMLKAVERYFAVLLARAQVGFLTQQQVQVDLLQQETQTRFELGDRPVTDSYAALAHAQSLHAQVLAAQMQETLAVADFTDLTAQAPQTLLNLPLAEPLQAPSLAPLTEWLSDVLVLNPLLLMHEKGLNIAAEQVAEYSSWSTPTVALVGRLAHDKLDGSGSYGAALNQSDEWMVGVQVNIPIFTGGYRSAKHREALHLQDKNQAEGDVLRQQVKQQTRAAWLGVQVNAQQVQALQKALQANNERLASTRLGHELGDNTTLERLDAENKVAQVQFELLQAKVSLIVHQLQLAALVGALDEAHLLQANQYLHTN
ncbi:MAG: TolC family protein [Pseudomonas sp.]|nr:TolC family protein [Pseudomonas sp.]